MCFNSLPKETLHARVQLAVTFSCGNNRLCNWTLYGSEVISFSADISFLFFRCALPKLIRFYPLLHSNYVTNQICGKLPSNFRNLLKILKLSIIPTLEFKIINRHLMTRRLRSRRFLTKPAELDIDVESDAPQLQISWKILLLYIYPHLASILKQSLKNW